MPTSNKQPFKTNTDWDLKNTVMFCVHHFFCSQVFKTMSNANSDVNIALIAFCSLMMTNYVSSPADVESTLMWCGLLTDTCSLLQSFVLALL